MRIERGSTWNKWDFHIHTPYSRLNTSFGFDPNCRDSEEDFDNYVKILFTKAVDKGVVAIGITDYFFIDGYKRIRQEYFSKPDKMKLLFPEDDLREQVMKLFVFPNIEFRLNTFVGVECHSVNYHVFFSDEINITDIEDNFLCRLNVFLEPNTPLTLTPSNVRRLGREYKIHNPEERRDDFIVGLEKATIDDSKVVELLSGNSIFQNRYFISVPVNEKLCKLPWNGRDYFPKRSLYKQCDMFMASDEKTRNWALGKGGREQKQIEEFGGLKPCIWGSDAHSYEKLFSPAENRFCWIKSEPTFEGLRQIICEPAERVRIQSTKPEQKNEHQIIDNVIFKSPQIISTPIYLNEGLNTVIGGKSTGKSIFLRNIARQLAKEQVDERESLVSPEKEQMDVDVEVYWKDGISDKRKIIYIPQSWLNRVVDDDSGDSQLNNMLEELLLQQDEIVKAHIHLKARIAEITTETRKNIIDYVAACKKVQNCEKKLRETGGSEAYRATIRRLESSRQSFSAEMKITEEQLKKYTELEKSIAEKNDRVQKIIQETESLSAVILPFVFVPGFTAFVNDNEPKYNFEGMQITGEQLKRIVGQMNEQISKTWLSAIPSLKEKLDQEEKEVCDELSPLQEEYQKIKVLISHSDEIKKIELQLEGERSKLKEAVEVEKSKKENETKAELLKRKILDSRQSLRTEYENFIAIVRSVVGNLNTTLQFDVEVVAAREEFADTVENLFDKRKARSFKEQYGYDAFNKSNLKINDKVFKDLWNAMIGGVLVFKGTNTVQNALERLFSDWFHVHYIVKSGDDTINRMSQGKKALVLLEMIVNLDNNNCPLLIDQPEDDLDNRSIYNELVQYLRNKKHERQIIVVTHNANVVIGADAEEVIIANQNGDDTPNYSKQFEYRCGAIENVSPICSDDGKTLLGVLNEKGIQQQICDILEGGKEAFELRRRKYLLG